MMMILRNMQHDLVIGCSSDMSATDYVLQICVCLCVCVSISCEPDIAIRMMNDDDIKGHAT